MRLLKGENNDVIPVNQPENSWREAMNMVFSIDTMQNEKGLTRKYIYTGYIPIGELRLPDDSLLVFLTNNAGDSNKIVRHYEDSVIDVTSFYFGITKYYPVRAKAKYTNSLDIEVVFTDAINPPRHITIDKNTGTIKESDVNETLLFPSISVPNFELVSVEGGGTFLKGSYFVTIAYNFGDKSYTNWVGLSNQIVLSSGGQGFTIKVTDLDTKFESFKIGILKVSDDITVTAEETLVDFNIESTDKLVTIVGGGRTIDYTQILVKPISYDRIGDFAVLDNRLYIADLYRDAVLDYQQYANNIQIEPVYDDVIALDSDKDSYSDPLIIFDKVGFQDDEVYAFYIRLHLKDGTIGGDFFIPANGAGTMGVHTNTEQYPNGKDYPVSPDTYVRHHRFPKKSASDFIINNYGGASGDSTRSGNSQVLNNNTDGANAHVSFFSTSGSLGTPIDDSQYGAFAQKVGVSFSNSLDVQLSFSYDISATVPAGNTLKITFQVIYETTDSNNVTTVYTVYGDYVTISENLSGSLIKINNNITKKVKPNDKLYIRGIATRTSGTTDISQFNLIADVFYDISITGIIPDIDASLLTKPTGIKVTNIVIPPNIASKIQGYEILYAVRNGSNSRILGQSMLYGQEFSETSMTSGSVARFHSPDVLLTKPKAYPTHIESQFSFSESNNSYASKFYYLASTPVQDTYTSEIVRVKYVPNDNIAANNEHGEEHLSFMIKTNISDTNRKLVNLVVNKSDYYVGFESQILQSTGKVFKINTSGTYTIDKLYGGDCYTFLYKVRQTRKRPEGITDDSYIRNAEFVIQSKYNFTLREWGFEWYQQPDLVYPPSSLIDVLGLTSSTSWERMDYTKRYTNYFKYDRAFNFGNKFIQGKIQGDKIREYPFRVARTPEQNLELQATTWRTFLPDDYYEQNRDRGYINNLEVIDSDKLIIHHENGLFITNSKEKLAATATEIVIGTGDIFQYAPKEIIYTTKGYLGSRHKFANFVSPMGYTFISNGRIYLLSNELKSIDMGNFMTFYPILSKVGDNPYLQDKSDSGYVGGVSIAYDDVYSRLIFSVNSKEKSFTKSYSKFIQAWVSGHSYTDCKIFDTGTKLYSFYNNSLYSHNSGNEGEYYNGIEDSTITIVANRNALYDKIFQNVNWKLYPYNFNFKSIEISTERSNIAEDIIEFIDIYNDFNTRRKHTTWFFNKLTIIPSNVGDDETLTGLYAIIKLVYDNNPIGSESRKVSIIDIDYDYQIIDEQ